MALAAKEVMWLVRVMKEAELDIGVTVKIRSDNQSAIKWATGEKCPSGRAKHIDVRVHFIRGLVKDGIIDVDYIPSESNDADMLTKPLGPRLLGGILTRIGLGETLEEEC